MALSAGISPSMEATRRDALDARSRNEFFQIQKFICRWTKMSRLPTLSVGHRGQKA
jgi:hypothetical protein